VLNRRIMRLGLFHKPADYLAFARVVKLGLRRPDRPELLGWRLMPNHWRLVLLAKPASDLSTWMQWLTVTHTHRWHQHYRNVGQGPIYQGRFKSFPIQDDGHLLTVLRYVEAKALRARLVERAEDWHWGSLRARLRGAAAGMLGRSPVDLPADWAALLNDLPGEALLEPLRQSVNPETSVDFVLAKWRFLPFPSSLCVSAPPRVKLLLAQRRRDAEKQKSAWHEANSPQLMIWIGRA
jgi:putative transposase